jgi:hypothetical protein
MIYMIIRKMNKERTSTARQQQPHRALEYQLAEVPDGLLSQRKQL